MAGFTTSQNSNRALSLRGPVQQLLKLSNDFPPAGLKRNLQNCRNTNAWAGGNACPTLAVQAFTRFGGAGVFACPNFASSFEVPRRLSEKLVATEGPAHRHLRDGYADPHSLLLNAKSRDSTFLPEQRRAPKSPSAAMPAPRSVESTEATQRRVHLI